MFSHMSFKLYSNFVYVVKIEKFLLLLFVIIWIVLVTVFFSKVHLQAQGALINTQ